MRLVEVEPELIGHYRATHSYVRVCFLREVRKLVLASSTSCWITPRKVLGLAGAG